MPVVRNAFSRSARLFDALSSRAGIFALVTAAMATIAVAARGEVAIAASTSYVLPGAPARLTELGAPVALGDGGTALPGKLEGNSEQVLLINRPDGVAVIRGSDIGHAATVGDLFRRVAANDAEVLFIAAVPAAGPFTQSPLGLYRADPDGPVLLIDDIVAAVGQQRYSWSVAEWTARSGAFAMLSSNPLGRLGFAPMSTALSLYRGGAITRIAATQTGTPALMGLSDVALDPTGTRVFFRGILGHATAPGQLTTVESGVYCWDNGSLRTIIDPQTTFGRGRISIASLAVGDDGAIAFFDSRRGAIGLSSEGRLTELVASGSRATDATVVELNHVQAPAAVLRIDDTFVYFIGARRIMNPWGEEGARNDVIYRVPRKGGTPEVFFHPARVLADATRIIVSNLTLSGDAPHVTFLVREIWGTQQAVYRATPPFGPIAFPAVPAGYPSVVLKAGWPDGFFQRAGNVASVEAEVTGPGPLSYAWFLNGQRVNPTDTPHVVAADGRLTLFPFAQPYHTGNYTIAVTNAAGASFATAPVFVGAGSYSDGGTLPALVNYSVRGFSAAAESTFTAGVALTAPIEATYNPGLVLTHPPGTTQQLLVRAVGPGLAPFSGRDVLPAVATRLELFKGGQLIARNDGAWNIDSRVASAAAAVGAFPLVPGSPDSALLATLPPEAYTAQVTAPDADGTVLVEFYVVQGRGSVRNLSARGFVADTEPRSLTLGFVIRGSGARPVLLRAVGPGLGAFGISNPARQVRLELYSAANTLLARNATHGAAPNAADLPVAAQAFGAFPLTTDSSDAAILLHLPEGVYIGRATAAPGSPGGVALIELYTSVGYDFRN